MKDSHYRISLDIHSTQSQVSLPVKQGDTSRKVFISLCEGGKPYQIDEDCLAVFSARKPDGNIIENNCIIADNVIEYTFTEQTTTASGMLQCEIKLYGGVRGLIASPRFTVICDARAVSDAEVESSSEYSALTKAYTEIEETRAQTLSVKEATEALKNEVETKLANGEFKGDPADYNLVSNALKGYVSGNPVLLEDVSPVEHIIDTKIHGKNFFDVSKIPTTSASANQSYISEVGSNYIVVTTPESYTGNGFCTVEKPLREICPQLTAGKTYMLNADSNSGLKRFYFSGTSKSWEFGKTMTVTAELLNSPVTFYGLSQVSGNGFGDCKISNIQIEEGVVATEYKPYIDPTTVTLARYGANETDNPQTYTPKADGTVEGVTSLYPTTTLLTDTEGVAIDVEYNRDINILTKAVPLYDRITGIPYYLYVSGGKLLIEEREV